VCEKPYFVIASNHAPVERHLQMKIASLGSWFDRLTTSGWDAVRPEALEGRTGYLQSSEAKQSSQLEIASSLTLLAMTFHTLSGVARTGWIGPVRLILTSTPGRRNKSQNNLPLCTKR